MNASCTAVMRVRLHLDGAPAPLPAEVAIRLMILDHGSAMHGIVVQGALAGGDRFIVLDGGAARRSC